MSQATPSRKRTQSFNKDTKSTLKRRKHVAPKSSNPIDKNGISQCFQKVTTRLYVSLAPCYISNVIAGIKAQHLDPLVMTYFPKVKGVVLSYFNIKLSEENMAKDEDNKDFALAKVSNEGPFAFMWITVDLLVWQPRVGDIIEGHSYMETASHIGLLLHDTFNASVKKNNIPTGWKFIPNQVDELAEVEEQTNKYKSFGHWVDENEVQIEGKLRFTIKSIHTTGKVVSVEGTLIKPNLERDALPIFRERRTSLSKHKKFDEDTVVEIAESAENEALPSYEINLSDNEDGEIVNKSSSDEEDSD